MKIDVLGTEYELLMKNKEDDKYLEKSDGYCDRSTKKLVVCNADKDNELDDFEAYQKLCIRHEIIHAFLYESGLANNWEHKPFGHDETYVDWIACQSPKLIKAFEAAGAL